MPYSEELGREYTIKESRFWKEANFVHRKEPGATRLIPIAQQFGIDEARVGQIGRTWHNDGLIIESKSGRVIATLTKFGRDFEFDEP